MPTSLMTRFRALHDPREMLLLPNAWDTASAQIQARAGAKAIATSSAALCWALGYADGGALPMGELLGAIRRIARTLTLPLTVDIEDGYSDSPEAVAELAVEVQRCGAVGINIEDGDAPSDLLVRKIQAIRSKPQALGLFINARTDVYLRSLAQGPAAVAMAVARGQEYAEAGADGLFVPGLVHLPDIEQIASATNLALNLMALPGLADAKRLQLAGVRRLSAGPAMFLSAYARLDADTAAFLRGDAARLFTADALPFASTNNLFESSPSQLVTAG